MATDANATEANNYKRQEDHFTVIQDPISQLLFAGVYDGHGRSRPSGAPYETSQYLKENFHNLLFQSLDKNNFSQALLSNAVIEVEKCLFEQYMFYTDNGEQQRDDGGSTLVCALFNYKTRELVLGNVGDSRLILGCKEGKVSYATEDHKPNNSKEKKRIESNGGKVTQSSPDRPCRVDETGLSTSRAIASFSTKNADQKPKTINGWGRIISEPEAEKIILNDEDVVVLVCDGITDVLSNEEIIKIVCDARKQGQDGAAALINKAKELKSQDNLTAVVLYLNEKDSSGNTRELEEYKDPRLSWWQSLSWLKKVGIYGLSAVAITAVIGILCSKFVR